MTIQMKSFWVVHVIISNKRERFSPEYPMIIFLSIRGKGCFFLYKSGSPMNGPNSETVNIQTSCICNEFENSYTVLLKSKLYPFILKIAFFFAHGKRHFDPLVHKWYLL